MAQRAQSVRFDKAKWTLDEATGWLEEHDLKSDKVDETENQYRFRQFDPELCKAGTFQTLTEDMPDGVEIVTCDAAQENAGEPGVTMSTVLERVTAGRQLHLEGHPDRKPMADCARCGREPEPPRSAAVQVQKSFLELWESLGRDPRQVHRVGRERAERLGKPKLAEHPLVFHRVAHQFNAETADETALMLDVVVSTEKPNRHGDIVFMDGGDFEVYRRYPLVLLSHGEVGLRTDDPTQTILGKNHALTFGEAEGFKALIARDELRPPSTGSDIGERIWKLTQWMGMIGASMGFDPTATELRFEDHEGSQIPVGINFREWEKVEHSITTIPLQKDSLAKVVRMSWFDRKCMSLIDLSPETDRPEDPGLSDSVLCSALGDLEAVTLLTTTAWRIQRCKDYPRS